MQTYNYQGIPVDVNVIIEFDYLSLVLLTLGIFIALVLALFFYSKM